MNSYLYNNVAIASIAMNAVLQVSKSLTITKSLLILPFITHKRLLSHLAHSGVKMASIEQVIAGKTSFFLNFNKRFYDSLSLSINAIQLSSDLEFLKVSGGKVHLLNQLEYSEDMGSRAKRIYKASNNIGILLEDDVENLYLNLRIEL